MHTQIHSTVVFVNAFGKPSETLRLLHESRVLNREKQFGNAVPKGAAIQVLKKVHHLYMYVCM